MMPLSDFLSFYRGEPDVFRKTIPHFMEYRSYSANLQQFHNSVRSGSFLKKRKTFLPYANQLSLIMAAIYHSDNPELVFQKTSNSHLRNHSDLSGLLREVRLQLDEQWSILAESYLEDNNLSRQDAVLLQNRVHTQAIYAVMSLRKDAPYEVRGLYPETAFLDESKTAA